MSIALFVAILALLVTASASRIGFADEHVGEGLGGDTPDDAGLGEPSDVVDEPSGDDVDESDSDTGSADDNDVPLDASDEPPATRATIDQLRKKAGTILTDEELEMFLDAPEKLDVIVQAQLRDHLRKTAATEDRRPKPEEREPASPPAEKPAVPSDFKVDINPEAFDDDPAKETARVLQALHAHLDAKYSKVSQNTEKIMEVLSGEQEKVATNYQSQLFKSVERLRKEMGSEFADALGTTPVNQLVRNASSAEYQRLNDLVVLLQQAGSFMGKTDPSEWDADYVRSTMLASGNPEFVKLVKREPAKKLAKQLNGKARTATTRPASRKKAEGDVYDRDKLIEFARKQIGF